MKDFIKFLEVFAKRFLDFWDKIFFSQRIPLKFLKFLNFTTTYKHKTFVHELYIMAPRQLGKLKDYMSSIYVRKLGLKEIYFLKNAN